MIFFSLFQTYPYLLIMLEAEIQLWKRVIINMSDIQETPRPSSDTWKQLIKHIVIPRTVFKLVSSDNYCYFKWFLIKLYESE